LEYALAGTCVFAKQSLDAILCDRFPLGLYGLTYHRHPLSRSYGVILPSSFSVNHSSTLGFSPRLPVSDCGTVDVGSHLRSFSRQCALDPFAGSENPFGISSRLTGRICLPGNAYHLASESTTRRIGRSCVPPQAQTNQHRYGNIDPLPIGYAFRPHLRDRLTLS
jgi:hypothetical protein